MSRDIPDFLSHLHIGTVGLPLPYIMGLTSVEDRDGPVEWEDEEQKDWIALADCVRFELCQVCGWKLDTLQAFMGTLDQARKRLFDEAPLHKRCAEYSADYCPVLRKFETVLYVTSEVAVLTTEAEDEPASLYNVADGVEYHWHVGLPTGGMWQYKMAGGHPRPRARIIWRHFPAVGNQAARQCVRCS